MDEMKKKELRLAILRAQTAKLQLEIDIDNRMKDVVRMEEHMKLQDKIIEEKQAELNG